MEHKLPFEKRLEYPIGDNLRYNLNMIESMNEMLYKILHEYYPGKKVMLFCRGSSGAILAAMASLHLIKKQREVFICHIKKDGEESHSGNPYSARYERKENVLVVIDDFISSGATISSIIKHGINATGRRNLKMDILCVSGIVPENMKNSFEHIMYSKQD